MAEELRPTEAFALRGDDQNIWHIAVGERWSDGTLIGHHTYCGRNYPPNVNREGLEGLEGVCSDCEAQVTRRH